LRPAAPDVDDDDVGELDDDDKEIVEQPGYEVPSIFLRDGAATHTKEPIAFIYVHQKQPSKQMAYVDFRPVDQLQDLGDLLEQFGPGTYTLQGRGENRRQMMAQVTVVVGQELGQGVAGGRAMDRMPTREPMDLTKVVAGVAAAAAPVVSLVLGYLEKRDVERREDRDRERERMSEERRRDDERNERFMATMTGLMKARNEELTDRLTERQQQQAPGEAREKKAYQDGLADALALIDEAKENGGGDIETRVLSLIESFAAGKQKGDSDAEKAIAAATAAANGAT
jgi:hypothetical protein